MHLPSAQSSLPSSQHFNLSYQYHLHLYSKQTTSNTILHHHHCYHANHHPTTHTPPPPHNTAVRDATVTAILPKPFCFQDEFGNTISTFVNPTTTTWGDKNQNGTTIMNQTNATTLPRCNHQHHNIYSKEQQAFCKQNHGSTTYTMGPPVSPSHVITPGCQHYVTTLTLTMPSTPPRTTT